MKRICNKLFAILLICSISLSPTLGYAEDTLNLEHETFTKTVIAPWMSNYHLITEEQMENNYMGGEGGQINYSFAVHPADENLMLGGNDTAGVYTSDDAGKTWVPSESGIGDCVISVAYYPGDRTTAFALCGGFSFAAGVYKTVDGGKNWERVHVVANKKRVVNGIAFGKPDNHGVYPIYAISASYNDQTDIDRGYTGVFKSTDIGQTWENLGLESYNVTDVYADDDSDLVVAVTHQTGVNVSSDGGKTWSTKNEGIVEEGVSAIAVNPTDKKHWVIAGKEGEDKIWSLYESLDSGENWVPIATNWGTPAMFAGATLRLLEYSYPDDDDKVKLFVSLYETNYPIRISHDDGRTFSIMNVDFTNFNKKDGKGYYPEGFAFSKSNPNLIIAGSTITTRSEDGGKSFTASNSGMSGALAHDFTWDENGKLRYVAMVDLGLCETLPGYDGDFPPTVRDTDYPRWPSNSTNTSIAVDPKNPMHSFSLTGSNIYGDSSTIVETFDGYDTYSVYVGMGERLDAMGVEKGSKATVDELFISKTNSNVVYGTWFVSENNGVSWRETQYPVRTVSPFDGDIVYSISSSKLYISFNRAKAWTDTGITLSNVNKVLVHDLFEDHVLWAGVHGGSTLHRINLKDGTIKSFSSSNNIKSKSGQGLQITGFAQNPRDKQHLVVLGRDYYYSERFVFESYDGGDSWATIEKLPEACNATAVKFHPSKPHIYLGTHQGTMIYDYEVYQRIKSEAPVEIE